MQEVILVTSTCIYYFLVVSAAGAAVVSTVAAVVSTVAAAVSTVAAAVSAVASVVSALLQAVIKPATARIANTFFIVLVFGFFIWSQIYRFQVIFAKIFLKFYFFRKKIRTGTPLKLKCALN